ncbi:MAG: hypothetical protein ACQES1_11130, partial [Bacteroidota bacterium]
MKTNFRISITLIAITALILTSCNLNNTPEEDQSRELTIVYTDWSESIALTHLSYILLEEKLGY